VIRTIDAFHVDDFGDWVAELSCLHAQHVRHRPPFWDRPWVLSEEGRAGRIATGIECPLCDRAELPPDLELARIAGPFDAVTLPPALRKDHRVAARTWGVLVVLEGSAGFDMATDPPTSATFNAGSRQPIPPGVPHRVALDESGRVQVEFFVRPAGADPAPA
jgi:tellurite methyltransferase